MADVFASQQLKMNDPGASGAAVTPHDTNALANVSRGVYVGTGGSLVVVMAGNSAELTFQNVPSGTLLSMRITHVKTASTAGNILAIW